MKKMKILFLIAAAIIILLVGAAVGFFSCKFLDSHNKYSFSDRGHLIGHYQNGSRMINKGGDARFMGPGHTPGTICSDNLTNQSGCGGSP